MKVHTCGSYIYHIKSVILILCVAYMFFVWSRDICDVYRLNPLPYITKELKCHVWNVMSYK